MGTLNPFSKDILLSANNFLATIAHCSLATKLTFGSSKRGVKSQEEGLAMRSLARVAAITKDLRSASQLCQAVIIRGEAHPSWTQR